jgi:pseudouridylate synthase
VVVGTVDAKNRDLFTRFALALGHDHIVPVGTMPLRQHGVLMLTNDGDLARWLEHPSARIQSTYAMRVSPPIDVVLAHELNTKGVNIQGTVHREFLFMPFTSARSRNAIRIKVRAAAEPGARQPPNVKQVLEHLGRRLIRGARVSFGPFLLKGLSPGTMREVAVPQTYSAYANPVWAPFIERDWPYFRRLRLARLKKAARWRHLSDAEMEEVDAFTADELRSALSFDSSAVAAEAREFAEAARVTPEVVQPPLREEPNVTRW